MSTENTDRSYLKIGYAPDVEDRWEYIKYRLLEMLPAFLTWGTFAAMIIGSFLTPAYAAIFIILFDIYWFLRSMYFSLHLRVSFRVMNETLKTNWLKELDKLDLSQHQLGIKSWRNDLWHMIILPYYKEGYEVLRSSFEGLANSQYPVDRFIVVLSGEARAGEKTREIGERIKNEYGSRFGYFYFTMHEDQPGELAGKGSNETWAIRHVKEEIIDKEKIPYEKIVVSVFDVDTVPSQNYFSRLTYKYLTTEKPLRTSFQPLPLFINNIWEAPGLARVISFSTSFFHMMNQMRPEKLVSFSSHAFPFKALTEIGFWHTNVVSEDSRIFWQALLTFDGDWRVEPLNIPVSMDANVAETFWQTMKNTYKQQRRWAYGAAEIPFFLYGFSKNKKIPFRTKFHWAFHLIEGHWSWGTNSLLIFVMGWLPVIVGGSHFNTTVLAYNAPQFAKYIMTAAMLGITTFIYLSLILLPPRPLIYGKHKYVFMVLQWIFLPLTLILSGAVPAIEAQTRLFLGKYMGFWPTPKIRKGIQKTIFSQ